ncbi:MAG TPA: hypothetical protein VIR45_09225, partial [Kiloniellaceae bacterium]
MEAALAALGFGKSRGDLRPISRVGIELAFRICDLMVLGLIGLVAFFVRQIDDIALHYPLYLGAILLAIVVAMPMLHRFDVYRDDFLYSKRIPYGSLFAAWTVTFCILLAAAFLMK